MSKFIVVGGLNKDVLGLLREQVHFSTSNPCSTKISFGGVGYNVARQLSSRGHEVQLVSLLGRDQDGTQALIDAERYRINTSLIERTEQRPTATYFGFCHNGEMLIAFADMDIITFLNPDFLESILTKVKGADALIVDANILPESCEFLSRWCKQKKIFFAGVAVSTEKMKNFAGLVSDFDCLVMNKLEARALIKNYHKDHDDKYFDTNVLNLQCGAITEGAKGVTIIEGSKATSFQAPRSLAVVDSHGAGDAFAAGFISGRVQALPLDQAVSMAFKWAQKTLQHWGSQP